MMGTGADNTAAITAGGYSPSPTGGATNANTEIWNGTNWTEVNDLNQGRHFPGSSGGVYTSALAFGGSKGPPGLAANTEDWNGSSWAETSDMNTARINYGSPNGTTTAAITAGSSNPSTTATEEWSGSSNVTKTISTD